MLCHPGVHQSQGGLGFRLGATEDHEIATVADAGVSRLRHIAIEWVQVQIGQYRTQHRPLWHPSNWGPLLHPFQDILVKEPLEQIEQCPITDLLCDTRQQGVFGSESK